jgi:hypothetical protein
MTMTVSPFICSTAKLLHARHIYARNGTLSHISCTPAWSLRYHAITMACRTNCLRVWGIRKQGPVSWLMPHVTGDNCPLGLGTTVTLSKNSWHLLDEQALRTFRTVNLMHEISSTRILVLDEYISWRVWLVCRRSAIKHTSPSLDCWSWKP